MAYTIVNKYIPASKYAKKSPYAMTPEYVTIHNTANDATALNEIAYMTRNNNATSYHVAIDDKYAVQAIPFSRNAWHAGDGQGAGNRKSIGIEICYSKTGGAKYYAAEANAIEYVAYVLKQRGWGINRVKWHRDWSGKNCPHRIIAERREAQVRNAIAAKLREISSPAPRPPVASRPIPKPTPKPQEVVDDMSQKLQHTQQDDMRGLLKRAYDEKVFTVNHAPKVDTMTRGRALDLLISYVAREKK